MVKFLDYKVERIKKNVEWLKNNIESIGCILDTKYPEKLRKEHFKYQIQNARDCIIRIEQLLLRRFY